jgi:DNA-binding winged helix-turn-helix (wHTH) protein
MRFVWTHCVFDADARALMVAGEPRPLPPKALRLLELLLVSRPRALARDELMQLLWPDTFVSDSNLAVLIGDLRAALGDSSRVPTMIKTHHRHGYSFVAEVTEVPRRATIAATARHPVLKVGGRRILLTTGDSVVGRDADCDVVIDHASVSRRHAIVSAQGSRVRVRDNDSKNGTYVNGSRVDLTAPVGDGDTVKFGAIDAVLTFELGSDISTQTVESELGQDS